MASEATPGRAPDIAIIGMAGRFPKAANIDQLWANLRHGVEALSTFDRAEMLEAGVDPALLDDPDYVPVSGALEDADLFAASFFRYSAREALIMDPQQRIFLETAWQALENAGYGDPPPATGVFAGVSVSTYLRNRLVYRPELVDGFADIETTLGTDKDFLATRVAYKLDLRGPAVVVQSACSSSLVAVHLACQALATGDCELALAGGSSIDVPRRAGYLYKPEGIYSSDGHCRPFDARADGMVGGSGSGVVVLKPLDLALNDGDTIHAVLIGSAINNDGAGKVGYTAPSIEAQAEVIAKALERAGVEAESIGLVETHGTGTALGDPIELAALSEAFATSRRGFCALGAVKANIGHLNAAAGISGLIKATLAVREGELPPAIHFETPSPHIDLDHSPFYFNTELQPWPATKGRRRAGVSSFGMGGTNAHVLIEQAPPPLMSQQTAGPRTLVLSAQTEAALAAARNRLADAIEEKPESELHDVAFTLWAGRKGFAQRAAIVCDTAQEGARLLRSKDRSISGMAAAGGLDVAFLFPGQGAQHPGMARELYQTRQVFRRQLDRCCDLFSELLPVDLRQLILAPAADTGAAERLTRTELAQTSLFAVQVALTRLWRSVGIEPTALLGHSIGEYTAACVAGVLGLEEAVELIAKRGKLLQQLPPGAMLAVRLHESEVRSRLNQGVVVAAVNEAGAAIVSGDPAAVAELERKLVGDGVAVQSLKTSHAFHSPLMRSVADDLRKTVRKLDLAPPEIPFISNVSGTWITDEQATDPDYWAEHLTRPVRFLEGLTTLFGHGVSALLEVGPSATLTALAKRHPRHGEAQRIVATLPHAKSPESAERSFQKAAATLWSVGAEVNARALADDPGRRVPLPTYPFERQRFWIDAVSAGAETPAAGPPRRLPMEQRLPMGQWCHVPSWTRAPLPPPGSLEPEQSILVFDDGDLAERLLASTAATVRIISVRAAGRFTASGSDHFEIDPRDPSHYQRLIRSIGETRMLKIVHRWATQTSSRDLLAGSGGFDSLLLAAQVIGKAVRRADWLIVTGSAHEVTGEEPVDPDQATVLGPCRVIPLEYEGHRCRNVDLASPELSSRQLELLRRELAFPDDRVVIAYRNGHRWLPSYTPLPSVAERPRPEWLEDGVRCLITGGLQGVGAALAEAVAEHCQARFALLARSPLPPRGEWDELLSAAAEGNHPTRMMRTVLRLEELGGSVLTLESDVSDRTSLAAAVETARRQLGGIDLVVHAAGAPGGGAIELKTLADADRVMAAKVRGTRHLWDLTRQDDPAGFVLCSSLAAEIGGFGQVDYCAANLYQDAFATARRGSRAIQTIDWDTWSETGMAVDTEVPHGLEAERAESLRLGLSTSEGKEIFLRILASGENRVLVSTRPLLPRLTVVPTDRPPVDSPSAAEPSGEREGSPRPALSTHFSEPDGELEQHIADLWRQLFGLESIGRDDDFFELGGHSLLATQLLNRLRKTHPAADLSLATLFEHPTVAQLAEAVESASDAPTGADLPSLEELRELADSERAAVFERYLQQRAEGGDGEVINIETSGAQLVWDLRRDLGLSVYPHELRGADSVMAVAKQLAAIVKGELVAFSPARAPSARQHPGADLAATRNPSMIFLLCAPRSGSTLLRLMLAGHPRLFCPPELALLGAPGMAEWSELQHRLFARDGLTRALMEIEGLSEQQAQRAVSAMASSDVPAQEVYKRLQAGLDRRILVDKSPSYALDAETLARAEALFEAPRYILLTRHPLSVIDSFVRHRMQALLATGPVVSPEAFAADIWTTCNRHLLELETAVGERAYRLRYEDLVTSPATALRQLTDFLGLSYHPGLLDPYAGGRMIDGPGDPDILQHDGIDPRLADSWRQVELAVDPGEKLRQITARLGYELGRPTSETAPALADPDAAEALLERIDELSDEEVAAALETLMGKGDPTEPLSAQQERLWVAHHLGPEDSSHNLRSAVRIRGPLDIDRLVECVEALVRRHQQLSTTFPEQDGKPVARVSSNSRFQVNPIDLSDRSEDLAAAASSAVRREAARPFDLAAGPLLRLSVLTLAEREHIVVLTLHHIVCDAWSMDLLLGELRQLYAAAAGARKDRLPDLTRTYADFVRAQLGVLGGSRGDHLAAFWRQTLRDYPTVSPLPGDHANSGGGSQMSASRTALAAPEGLDAALRDLAGSRGVTVFMVLLGAFVALLHRLSATSDIVIVTPVANRDDERWERLVGYFVNLMPLRIVVPPEARFADLLSQVRATVIAAHRHQQLPLHRIAESAELRPAQLVRVLYQHVAAPTTRIAVDDLVFEPRPIDLGTTRQDLSLTTYSADGRLQGTLEYSTELFEASTAEHLKADLTAILEAVVRDPAVPLADLPVRLRRQGQPMPAPDVPAPNVPATEREQVESPAEPTGVEEVLGQIWCEVLELDTVSPFDNFLDVGGDSMLAMQFIERVERRLGVRLSPAELFTSTLAQIAATCEARGG